MEATQPTDLSGIAVVAMSGRFPGAGSVEEFWRNLMNGVETISRFGEDELEYSVATASDQGGGQKYVRARAVLDNVDKFDAAFFGITPRDAEIMDPQHRLFLECAWEALEAAGYDAGTYQGLIGTYASCSVNTYFLYHLCGDREFAANHAASFQVGSYSAMLGNDAHFLATRASYKLDLKGPSMSVQTACSSSLVAVCQACVSLQTYQCDMALAGGVSVSFPQKRDYLYQEGSLVSGDGYCRAFDAAADGTVFGHGVGVVLLKRLADAIEDKDTVLAVIKGTAVNNDGAAKVSYAAPSVEAQANVIALAQAAAGVHPESISYIEAHGTGTLLGDPIEIAALTKAFREGGTTQNGYCPIGSAKTHIGHLDAASGVTGLIKTVLQLRHQQIPALLNFRSPNPKIDFARSPFFPVNKDLEWKRGPAPRRAGVSAFGVGGTNAHVVVEEAPVPEPASVSRSPQLLVLSAKTESALEQMAGNLATHLEKYPEQNIGDVAFTLAKGRKSFGHRRALVVGDRADAISILRAKDGKTAFSGQAPLNEPEVVFLFPGQGAQFVDMGRSLYENAPIFRSEVDRCAKVLLHPLGLDIRSVLYPDARKEAAAKAINETSVTQPAIFVLEYALARLWLSWGIKPALVIGHSIGEYVCAVLAESMSLEDALALLSARARMMNQLPRGSMLAVRMRGEDLQALLPARLSLAAFNSPKLCTISGPTEVLATFQTELQSKKVASRFLATSHAFHSEMMEPMLEEFTEIARSVPRQPARLPWISTCTGRGMTAEDMADPAYWSRQLRQTVRFVDALGKLERASEKIFLEVGPGQTLTQLASQCLGKPACLAGDDRHSVLTALGRLWIAGAKPDWDALYAGERRGRVALPTYPFERKSHWVEPPSRPAAVAAGAPAAAAPAGMMDLAEQTIQEQLRLMGQQLDLLRGSGE